MIALKGSNQTCGSPLHGRYDHRLIVDQNLSLHEKAAHWFRNFYVVGEADANQLEFDLYAALKADCFQTEHTILEAWAFILSAKRSPDLIDNKYKHIPTLWKERSL